MTHANLPRAERVSEGGHGDRGYAVWWDGIHGDPSRCEPGQTVGDAGEFGLIAALTRVFDAG